MSKTKYVVLMYEIFRLSKNINFFQKSEVMCQESMLRWKWHLIAVSFLAARLNLPFCNTEVYSVLRKTNLFSIKFLGEFLIISLHEVQLK